MTTENAHSKRGLYDYYVEGLPNDDVSPPTLDIVKEKIQNLCQPKPSDSSTHHSNGRDSLPSETSSVSERLRALKPEEFLKKIYGQPVVRTKIHGFDYDEMSLKMLLLNERNQEHFFKLIGVVGVLGVGKTELCHLIFSNEQVKQCFAPRIWISMSEEPKSTEKVSLSEEPKSTEKVSMSEEPKSMEKIVERMLEHLGVEDEIIKSIPNYHKLHGLLYSLHLQLKGKRFLIVLDDVKEKDKYYEKLVSCLEEGHGFPKTSGGAVILTSRNEKAIKKIVGERNLHRVLPLSNPESCWRIFRNLGAEEMKKSAETESDVPMKDKEEKKKSAEMESDVPMEVKEQLKEKCGGYPLAARIMREIKLLEDIKNNGQKQKEEKANDGLNQLASTTSEAGLDHDQTTSDSKSNSNEATTSASKNSSKEASTA